MLSIQKQPKFLKKAVQLPNGAWVLVVFELIEQNGKIIARAVSGKILNDIEIDHDEVLCLPCVKSPTEFVPVQFFTPDFIHSFLKDFSFVKSQRTRAPSL